MKTFLNMPFDEDIFLHAWETEPDLATELLINSGALVSDPTITNAVSGGGQTFTVPFYKGLGGEPVLYNGKTDIPSDEIEGAAQTGVVYGFAKSWKERDFVRDLVGNDPMGHIVRSVTRYWQQFNQGLLVKILDAVLGATGMTTHTIKVNYSECKEAAIVTGLNEGLAKTFKNGRAGVSTLIMNTATAVMFENLNLVEYRKGVEAGAILGAPRVGSLLGMNIIVDDSAVKDDGTVYALGAGSIRTGVAPVHKPVGWERSESKNGGETAIFTRIRRVLHPDGMTFNAPSTLDGSPTIAELTNKANWKLAYDHELVPIAKITIAKGAAGP